MRRIVQVGLLAITTSLVLIVGASWDPVATSRHVHESTLFSIQNALAQSGFLATFDGQPTAPQAFTPSDWDITIDSLGGSRDTLEEMQAAHGPDCSAPPATHTTNTYPGSVYICNDHLMTAINGTVAGVIYLTPNQQLDFSGGEGVVRFDMSTFRMSVRDWTDLWISPFNEELQLAKDDDAPNRAVHIEMLGIEMFQAQIVTSHEAHTLTGTGIDTFHQYDDFLVPSAVRRDTFELRLSRTHVKFGMPAYNFWWIDKEIPDLGWDRGVVQFGHHSYDPDKGCNNQPHPCPNTWHWDNVNISPSVPFTILRADQRVVDGEGPQTVNFAGPASDGASLRFTGLGSPIQVSTDGGASWQDATRQPPTTRGNELFSSYRTPIPAGVNSVQFRGPNGWRVKDISIWSLATPADAPTPTCTQPVTHLVKEAPGVLRATLSAGGAGNVIRRVDFDPRGAIVRVSGMSDQVGRFSAAPQTASTSFQIFQRTPGTGATVFLSVTDSCGAHTTFVGGGPSAF